MCTDVGTGACAEHSERRAHSPIMRSDEVETVDETIWQELLCVSEWQRIAAMSMKAPYDPELLKLVLNGMIEWTP